MMNTTKTGLVPKEDMGSINVDVRTPPGTNIAETDKVMTEIDKRISTIPQIEAYSRTTGWGMMFGMGSSTGNMLVDKGEALDRLFAVKEKPVLVHCEDESEIKANLLTQLTAPVRWTQTVQNMIADGATDFVELGPGKVLQGLIAHIYC